MEIEPRVREILSTVGRVPEAATAPADADLYDLGLSSHATANVILGLEDAFDIEFPDEQMRREVFASVASIVETVGSLTEDA